MPKLLTILSLFLLLFLTSCFESEDATTGQEDGISLNGVVQISKDSLFTGTNDTVWIDVQLKGNTTYRFEIQEDDSHWGLDGAVYDQSNTQIGYSWKPYFETDNNTTYKLAVWADDPHNTPAMDFTYKIYKYEMPVEYFEGTWILSEETWEMQGNSLTLTYNSDSVEQLITITNDSITKYRYDSEMDKTNSSTVMFFSIFGDSHINVISETEFTVRKSFFYGSQLLRYKVYTEDITNTKWDRKDLIIPKEYYGNWYVHSWFGEEATGFNNSFSIDNTQGTNKEDDIHYFYSIDSNGITKNKNDGFTKTEEQPQWFTYRFIKNSSIQNNTIQYKFFEGDIWPSENFEVEYEEKILKKFSREHR